jgi:hypothetical protein
MVIIGKRAGQLGNRLFAFAHVIGNAIEYGYEVQNPSFYGYTQYFTGTREDFFCRYPARISRFQFPSLQVYFYRFITTCVLPLAQFPRVCRLLNLTFLDISRSTHADDSYDMTSQDYIRSATAEKRLIIKDPWSCRDFTNIKKHAAQVRTFFTPVEKHCRAVEDLVSRARNSCDLLVGVHIRQGDYKRWQGGAYFFSTSEYAAIMARFAAAMPEKQIRFLVCSNEKQDEELFQGLDYVMGTDHPVEDMYAFAACDFLVGPPSTYTAWASFFGSVPLYFLKTAADFINADEFHVTHG